MSLLADDDAKGDVDVNTLAKNLLGIKIFDKKKPQKENAMEQIKKNLPSS